MKRAPLCYIFGLCLLWVGIANAAPPKLKGKYAFTGTESGLLATTDSFDSTLSSPDAYGFSLSAQGIATFNGDGTGSVEGQAVGDTAPPPAGDDMSAWSEDFSYDFTYTVDKDGTIAMVVNPGSYTGTFNAGTLQGQTYTIVDQFTLSGMASRNNTVLTLGTVTPKVVEIDYSGDPTPVVLTRYEIGHYSLVFTWLGNGHGHRSHR